MRIRVYKDIYEHGTLRLNLYEVNIDEPNNLIEFHYVLYGTEGFEGEHKIKNSLSNWKHGKIIDLFWKEHPTKRILHTITGRKHLKD